MARSRRKLPGLYPASRSGGAWTPADWAFLTGSDYPEGLAPAGERQAMGLPPFGRGVALLCNAVAGTEWWAVRWNPDTGVDERLAAQPNVVTNPNPDQTPWNYKWAAIEDLILYGNHFALLGEADSNFGYYPRDLLPMPADNVWVITDPETGEFAFTVGGTLLSPTDLLHVSAGNRSWEPLGRGVLAQYGGSLSGAVAAEDHAGNYFAGGTLPPAVLQSPTILNDTQAKELKEKWRKLTNYREPVVMPMGYVLTPVVSNAEQAQLVESRQWNAEAVAMMLGIPAYKLGLPGTSMTYQNVESADIDFVRDSVDRYGRPLSEAFTKWLVPRGTSVTWNYAGRMRADQKTTAEVLTKYVAAGILTKDEARATIGRAPLPEAEEPPPPIPEPPPGPEPETETPEDVPDLTPALARAYQFPVGRTNGTHH